MSETFELWGEWLPTMLSGFLLSLQVCGLSLLFGIPLGLISALGVQSKSRSSRP